jgi:hypothetical protein
LLLHGGVLLSLGPASPFFVNYYRKGTSPSPFYTPFDGTSKFAHPITATICPDAGPTKTRLKLAMAESKAYFAWL